MSHFQLTDGTRLWVKNYENEKIAIHIDNEVVLEQWGSTDAFGKMPKIHPTPEGVVEVSLIDRPSSDRPFTVSKRRFSLKAVGAGTATINGKDREGNNISSPLKVVAGEFKNHEGMVKDLLADVGRSSDPSLIHKLQRLLHNDKNNLFNQDSDENIKEFGELACGRVTKAGGEKLIGRVISHSYAKDSSYHKRTNKVTSRDDVVYDPNMMDKVRRAIERHVKNGNPVLVGAAYNPKTSMLKEGHLQAGLSGGHSVLIVGCNAAATEFLYVDPFPGGSKLKYKGGIAHDSYPEKCHYLGVFKFDYSVKTYLDRGPVLRQRWDSEGNWFSGSQFLEVISGPKI